MCVFYHLFLINKVKLTIKYDFLCCTSFQFPDFDDIYCRYSYVYGQDWDIASVS